jgi:hypothetical protein
MADEIIHPIDEESAKAVQAVAKLGSDAIGAAEKAGSWVSNALGTVPQDLIGYYFGYGLRHKRQRRLVELEAETKAHHERWRTKPPAEKLSPSIGIPLLEAACDETRDGLKDLWSRLVAAAMDPDRTDFVRVAIIEAVKRMDPLDALVLREVGNGPWTGDKRDEFRSRAKVSNDEVQVSIENLISLGFLYEQSYNSSVVTTAKGTLLLRAVSDAPPSARPGRPA